MTRVITWYDVLGVCPDGPAGGHPRGMAGEKGRDLVSGAGGAPSSLLAAADRARQAADNAWRALADPTAREMYDVDIGFERPGEGF